MGEMVLGEFVWLELLSELESFLVFSLFGSMLCRV